MRFLHCLQKQYLINYWLVVKYILRFHMWEKSEIERVLEAQLEAQYPGSKGEEFYAQYILVRKNLVDEILPEIKAIAPELTDHGPVHVKNVLDNAYLLLGEDINKLSAVELYVLCVSILFHDVGNLHGRKKHNKNIAEIYDYARGGGHAFRDEKIAVMQIGGAHTGYAKDGTKNTLKYLGNSLPVYEVPIKAQKIAAILRFADEIAEGIQRTSLYMQNIHAYPIDSMLYHEYANITKHCIDKSGSRIAIDYHIYLTVDGTGQIYVGTSKLEEMLKYAYTRIVNLDQERRYNKHYCSWLANFKRTSVTFNFWWKSELLEIDIDPLELSDLVVPGDDEKQIVNIDNNYTESNIVKLIMDTMGGD